MDTPRRILAKSLELFNVQGVGQVSTNHVARALGMSPGNLYFHFRGKNDLVRQLFQEMTQQLEREWGAASGDEPIAFVERSFEVFWVYRFFHREMYALRRADPKLARLWARHLTHAVKVIERRCAAWIEAGHVGAATDTRLFATTFIMLASGYLQFFESPQRQAAKGPVRRGIAHLHRVLEAHYTPSYRDRLADYLGG
jgi:AcrR family transcriptional regulator